MQGCRTGLRAVAREGACGSGLRLGASLETQGDQTLQDLISPALQRQAARLSLEEKAFCPQSSLALRELPPN